MLQLPQEFEKRMVGYLGETEYAALLASYENTHIKGIRTNTLKVSVEDMQRQIPFDTKAVPWCATGFYIDPEIRPGKNPWYYAGIYYVQEPTAMTSVEALAPEPGDWVLDLCAAPGGKTTQLACHLEGEGLLVANELINNRAEMLAANVERMGVRNALLLNEFPERIAAAFPEAFDKILVDAPCSGEGMFRKDEGVLKAWSVDNVKRCAERQVKILESVDKMLKPGGVLVYSTCTFAPEENEQMMERLLATGRYALEPIVLEGLTDHGRPEFTESGNPDIAGTLRVMPHHVQGEGHFIARLRKLSSAEASDAPLKLRAKGRLKKVQRKDLKDYETFAKAYFRGVTFSGLHLLGDKLYSVPEGVTLQQIDGLRVLRPGLHVGTFKKNRFEPSHTLAMALKAEEFTQVYEVQDDDAAYTYLKGEPITGVDLKGWVLVCIGGQPLGFGKASQGMIKNHYPKGLRIRKK